MASAAPPSTARGNKDLEECSPGRTRTSEMTSLLLYSASPGTPGTRSSVFRSQLVLPPTYCGAQAAAEQKALGGLPALGCRARGRIAPGDGGRGRNPLRPSPPERRCCLRARGPLLWTPEGRRPPSCQRPPATPQAGPAVSHSCPTEGRSSFQPHKATVRPQEAARLSSLVMEERPALHPHGLHAGWQPCPPAAQVPRQRTHTLTPQAPPSRSRGPTLSSRRHAPRTAVHSPARPGSLEPPLFPGRQQRPQGQRLSDS